MKLELISHAEYQGRVPKSGRHILCQQQGDAVVVYQAYRATTAAHAVAHQCLGGPDYSYSRMSWIKPNFLWMMYRSGWASKQGQEQVLAIWIKADFFQELLGLAVHSSFQAGVYGSAEIWKEQMKQSGVMLQWDPDHNVYGAKEERRAVQLGLRGGALAKFGKESILHIENIGGYARAQNKLISEGKLDQVQLPSELVFTPQPEANYKHLMVSSTTE